MNCGPPQPDVVAAATAAATAAFMFGAADPKAGAVRNVLYLEGTSGVGKTTAMRMLKEQSDGRFPEGTFLSGDLLSVTDAPGYQLLVGHRCELDRNGVCTVELGDARLPRCPGPDFIIKCYEGVYMRSMLEATAKYRVVDRNCTFSGLMYSQVRALCAEAEADHSSSPTVLLRGNVRVRTEVLHRVQTQIRTACLLFPGDRFIIVLNEDPQGVRKMVDRQYFDVQGRSDEQVQQYLDVQNWVFEYAHGCLSGSKLLVGDGCHYVALQALILERYQAMVDEDRDPVNEETEDDEPEESDEAAEEPDDFRRSLATFMATIRAPPFGPNGIYADMVGNTTRNHNGTGDDIVADMVGNDTRNHNGTGDDSDGAAVDR